MTPEQNFGAPAECAEAGKQHEQLHQFDCIPEPTAEQGFLDSVRWYRKCTPFRLMPLGRLDNRPHPGLGLFGSFRQIGSRDPRQIEAYWGPNGMDPFANVGIVTGQGVLVLDVDVKNGVDGGRSLIEWEFQTGVQLPSAPRVITPSGGMHLFFAVVGACPSPIGWLPGVDVRADGGMVAAPPSRRRVKGRLGNDATFQPYRLVAGSFGELPKAPDALLADIHANGGRFRTRGGSSSQNASSLPPTADLMRDGFRMGERDDGFYRLACRLWSEHWPYGEHVVSKLREVWSNTDMTPADPYPWPLVEQKIESARQFIEPQARARHAWAGSLRRQP